MVEFEVAAVVCPVNTKLGHAGNAGFPAALFGIDPVRADIGVEMAERRRVRIIFAVLALQVATSGSFEPVGRNEGGIPGDGGEKDCAKMHCECRRCFQLSARLSARKEKGCECETYGFCLAGVGSQPSAGKQKELEAGAHRTTTRGHHPIYAFFSLCLELKRVSCLVRISS